MESLNKKGFTLVELLAVIVVLAIIMIIAVPQVLDSMKTAKQNTLKIEAKKAINLTMQKVQENSMNGGTTSGCFSFATIGLETGGRYSGSVKVSGTTYTVYIWDGEYGYSGKTLSQVDSTDPVTTPATNVTACTP